MAVDKLVDSTQLDADLTSVANAIRTKGGTSSQLAFPAGFVSAVQAIPTGGVTPTGTKQISITQNGVTTEDVTNYASAQIMANVPNTYAAADEGKVVDDGALVAQTSRNIDTNGTYDTTTNNEVTVNVSGGGDGFLIGGQTVRIKNTSASQQGCIRIRNVNYGTTHLGAYSTNIAAGATITSYNYFATFEKNGTKYIIFHTGHNPSSITYNGDPVAFVSTGSAAQWDVEIALPSGFDNTYTIDIGW